MKMKKYDGARLNGCSENPSVSVGQCPDILNNYCTSSPFGNPICGTDNYIIHQFSHCIRSNNALANNGLNANCEGLNGLLAYQGCVLNPFTEACQAAFGNDAMKITALRREFCTDSGRGVDVSGADAHLLCAIYDEACDTGANADPFDTLHGCVGLDEFADARNRFIDVCDDVAVGARASTRECRGGILACIENPFSAAHPGHPCGIAGFDDWREDFITSCRGADYTRGFTGRMWQSYGM